MIELTPKEVESCRRLKFYTEKNLAQELYDAIDDPAKHDAQTKRFINNVREMSKYALDYLRKITTLLKDSGVKDDKAINKMLREAGPLSVYYLLDRAKSDVQQRDQKYKKIKDTKDEKIKKYRDDIRTMEEADRNLNKNINTLLFKISKKNASGEDFKKCKLDDSVKNIVSEETKKIIDSNNILLDVLSKESKDELEHWMVMEGVEDDDGYFELKKHLDLDISRLYHKIEWQREYAGGLERRATADFCDKKLEYGDLSELHNKSEKLSPSDCSDIFRLFGTMMEELDKLKEEEWEKINKYYSQQAMQDGSIDPDKLKFCIQLQSLLRETSGLDVKKLFPKMPSRLARNITMPDQYQIDRGERFVKYCEKCKDIRHVASNGSCHYHGNTAISDRIEQQLKCTKCGTIIKMYFKAGKQAKEKPVEHDCPQCKANTKFEPLGMSDSGKEGIKPFWKDEIRARWRDTWSSTFILEYNSVVRAIDRTFGLPEVADISGTTADSIFGMEAVMNLTGKGQDGIGTGGSVELRQQKYEASGGYTGDLILLPLITMVKHGHHAILECALTFTLTGYIDSYHIGKYTSLWPKGTAPGGALWNILKKWEDSPSNQRILIERDENGFVSGGLLFDKDERLGNYEFSDVTKIDYQRYINIFLPLRDKMRDNEKIDADTLIDFMNESQQELDDLELDIIEKNGKRLKEKEKSRHNYNEFALGLKEYSCDKSIHESYRSALADLSAKYPPT